MQSKSKAENTKTGTRSDLRIDIPDDLANQAFANIRDLVERLHFSPTEGRIWMDDSRMFLLRTEALGALRQELIESLGVESARGLFTRMGYLCGSKAAALARKVHPTGCEIAAFMMGPQMHSIEGVVKVEPLRLEMDSATGHFYCEVFWCDSSEDESHMAVYGVGAEPACWMQTGYASGYSTAFMGKRILFREVECASAGDNKCRAIGKPVEEWDDPEVDLQYLQAHPLSTSRSAPRTDHSGPEPVAIGASAGYFGVVHRINRVAPTRASVLLLGESGVGKSMFAREIHNKSKRAAQPFVQLNCAAIPEQLMEAELFGVDRGAYTGVTESRGGRFDAAAGGTLFLDEVALLSFTAQAKLLRVLQSGEFEHLGSTTTRKVDVRVVAATNENLAIAVEEGRFRKDLYYRLNVFPILIPPLRERRADIPLLLERLLRELCTRHGRQVSGITNRAMEALLTYHWPGNIREFENVLERGIILADEGGAIDIPHLRSADENSASPGQLGISELASATNRVLPSSERSKGGAIALDDWATSFIRKQEATLEQIEAALLQAALASANGNVSKAATMLGLSRAQMDYRTKKLK